MQGKSLLAQFIATAPQQETWQQELQQHCSLRTADLGKAMIRYLGYCAKQQNKQQDTACTAHKTLHVLEMEGVFCSLGSKSLTLDTF